MTPPLASDSGKRPGSDSDWLLWTVLASHYFTWLKFLPNSFWLDECGTVWLIQGGFSDLSRRSLLLLHTPLFGAIAASAAAIGGVSEMALRVPSWIAAGLAIFLFYRLAEEVLEPESAQAALCIFACWPIVSYAAVDARPYAFAMASICGTYLYFLRSIRSGRSRDFALFCFFAALLVHLHLLFIYALSVPVLFLVLFDRPALRLYAKKWVIAGAVIAILVVPLTNYYLAMLTWGSRYSFSPMPSFQDLLSKFAPIRPLLFFLVAAILLAPLVTRVRSRLTPFDRLGLTFALLAATFPLFMLFVVSRFSEARLYVPRYLMPAAPGLALFWGWIIGRIDPAPIRYWIGVGGMGLILAAQWAIGNWHHERDDWRGALQRAAVLSNTDEQALVLYSGFVESGSLDSLRSKDQLSFILSPLAAYPARTPHVVALPLDTDEESKSYWDGAFRDTVQDRRGFTVILRAELYYGRWHDYLTPYARARGFRLAHREEFGEEPFMILLHFVRD
jgi:hypothetical protein